MFWARNNLRGTRCAILSVASAIVLSMAHTTTARHLKRGDVLAGSGFTVTHNAYAGVCTRRGYVIVEGFYPGGAVRAREWNANTRVPVA